MRNIIAITALSFVSFLTACGHSTAPKPRDIVGTFAVVSYDGKPLPSVVADSLKLISSVMTLNSDNVYSESVTYDHSGTIVVTKFAGIFSTDGRLLIVKLTNGASFFLDVNSRDILVENDQNGIIVYERTR